MEAYQTSSKTGASRFMVTTFHSPRDPGGLLPVGIESMMGEDPAGTVVSEEKDEDLIQVSQGLSVPATPTRVPPASPQVLALLAGFPPPPPPDAPPPRRRRSRSTPRVPGSTSKSIELPTEVSFSLDAEKEGDSTSLVPDPLSPPSPNDPIESNPVVVQQSQTAQAIFNGDHLASKFLQQDLLRSMDPPADGDRVMRSVLPQNQATPRLIVTVSQEKSMSPQRSPFSIVTEPRRNHLHVANPYHDNLLAPEGVVVGGNGSVKQDMIDEMDTSKATTGRTQLGNERSSHRRNHSDEVGISGKLLGQHRRSNTVGSGVELATNRSAKATRSKTPLTSQRRPATPDPANNSSSGGTVATGVTSGKSISSDSRSGRPSTPSNSNEPPSKPSRKGFFKLLFGGKKKRAARSEYNEVRLESEDARFVERTTEVTSGGNGAPVAKQELGVEETSGPRNEETHLLPAYSTDHYEDDHDFGDGRGSVVFAHDEVSTLTAPTMTSYHQRRDPAEDIERSSEPLGHYWNHIVGSSGNRDDSGFPSIDPFTEPFFQEPKGVSPVPKATASVELRVDVSQIADPVGESPLHSLKAGTKQNEVHDPSPQGFRLAPTFQKTPSHDPVGESPLHKHERGPTALLDGAPYAPDPPLHLSTTENEGSSTCSKEETGSTPSAKGTISDLSSVAPTAGHPPRPPSPNPAVAARVSPRRQGSPHRLPLRLHPFASDSTKSSSTVTSKTPSVSTCTVVGVADVSPEKEGVSEVSSALSVTVPKARNRPIIRISPKMGTVAGQNRYDSSGPVDSDAALFSLSFASNDSELISPSCSTIRSDFSPSNRSLVSQPTDEFDTFGSSLQKSSSNVSSSSKTSLLSRAEARKSRSRRSKQRLEEPRVSPSCHALSSSLSFSTTEGRVIKPADTSSQDSDPETRNEATKETPDTVDNDFQSTPTPSSEDRNEPERSLERYSKGKGEVQTSRSFSPKTLLRKKAQLNKKNEILLEPKQEQSDPKQSLHVHLDKKQGQRESKQVKQLTISSAARMNAKAVAYLHTISGEPSPRRAWRRPQESDEEESPSSGVTKNWAASKPPERVQVAEESPTQSQVGAPSPRLFSPYNGKFKGRGLTRKQSVSLPASTEKSTKTRGSKVGKVLVWNLKPGKPRNVSIGTAAVQAGVRMLRQNRIEAVASGRSTRVVPGRQVPTPKEMSYFVPLDDPEPSDPIQRAGRRLLSRAAIPVQSAARRFLAKRRAVDRMWALLEIQSYIRRWRAEASFLASRTSAALIQRIFRGSRSRQEQRARQSAATQIQKVVRGYIYAIRVYEDVYRVILVQALARRTRCRRKYKLLRMQATSIQTIYRGHLGRQTRRKCLCGVTKIQAHWRSYLIRTCYQFVVVDIIIAQSMLRRWLARRRFTICLFEKRNAAATKIQALFRSHRSRLVLRKTLCATRLQTVWRRFSSVQSYKRYKSAQRIQARWRGYSSRVSFDAFKAAKSIQCAWRCLRDRSNYERFKAVRKIQAKWRAYNCFSSYRQYRAATQIQACWRGFQGYTDYVFILVDVLVIQRSIRRWMSLRKCCAMRRERAARVIETNWRRHSAQKALLLDLMHIILVQSTARRYLTHAVVAAVKQERTEATIAATKIQASWRGFWQYSHYVILRYETVRLQSFFRGRKVHTDFIVTLGSIIVVQARCRQYLASKRAQSLRAIKSIFCSQSEALRETGAAKRIQFFWRVVLECRREKKAALVIERFFAKVKEEVDREIRRAARRKQSKRRRSHKKHSSNSDCESSVDQDWIDTLDELTFSKSRSTDSTSVLSRHSSSKRGTSVLSSAESLGHKSGVRHRASSPTLNLVMRHERETKSKSLVQVVTNKAAATHDDPQNLRRPRRFRLSLDASEDAVDSPEKYMKMYGVRSAPLRGSKERHFFKDVDVLDNGATPKSTISGPASTKSDASTSVGWRRLLVESNSSISLGEVGRDSARKTSSPRHGKILVMKPYPEHHSSHGDEKPDDADEEVGFLGDDFGMI